MKIVCPQTCDILDAYEISQLTLNAIVRFRTTGLQPPITPRMKITRRIYIDILLTALRGCITPRMKITRMNLYRHPVNRS